MFRALRALFGVYAFLFFILTLLVVAPAYVLIFLVASKKRSPHIAHGLSRVWASVLHTAFFQRVTIRNKEFIDPRKTYVFVANHRSQLDIPAYALSCKNTFRFLAKAELTKIPIMGYIIRRLYIPVNRKDRNDRNRSIEIMKRSLDEGVSVFLCPEGTRNRKDDPPLLNFHDGAFRLAIATKTPVAVLTLLNTGEKLSPNRPLELAPGKIHGVWDAPIDTSGMTMEDVAGLKEQVRLLMQQHLNEYRKR
jgi:1-acyl-sn-glycerol-3-phosphate acyltransferase